MSRRDLIRASAGAAAIAVPFSALSQSGVSAAGSAATTAGLDPADHAEPALELEGPVMFYVHDVASAEVSILHGTDEVIVHDRALVNRIVRAATARRAV